MKKFILFITLLTVSIAFVSADIYIKQSFHTDPVSIMGQSQPAKDEISEQWIGDNRYTTNTGKQSMIVDIDKNVMLMLNHKSRSYIEMSLPLDMSQYFPEQMAAMMKQMMTGVTVTVTPNGKDKMIQQWNCQGYNVQIKMNAMGMPMNMNMDVWASTDVPFDWKKVGEAMMSNMMKAQLRLSDSAIEEMKKVKGYWIAMEMSMNVMGADIKTSTQVVEITQKSPSADTYSVPAGYTKKDKLSMADMQQN